MVAFYADPSGWGEHVVCWEATHGRRLKVKATRSGADRGVASGKNSRVGQAVEEFRQAVLNGEAAADGSPSLTRVRLNARRRSTRTITCCTRRSPDSRG